MDSIDSVACASPRVLGAGSPRTERKASHAPAQTSASLIPASSDSDALKGQAAQELNVQPLMRAKSAPAQLLNNHSRPGAYYSAPRTTKLVAAQLLSSSRAVAMAEDLLPFMQEDSGASTEFNLEQSERILVCAAVTVEESDTEKQLIRCRIFDEAIEADVVESVAEAPLVEHDNRKLRKLSVYLLIACGVLTLLGLVVGLVVNVGLTKKSDVSGEDETPKTTPSEPFMPTLEAVRQRGFL